MRVDEIWRYKYDKTLVRIKRIWLDEPDDYDKMVSLELVDTINLNEEQDGFCDYFLDEFITKFEKVYELND